VRTILKAKWWIIAAWIAAIVLLLTLQPNMADLVHEKGQAMIPKGYSSAVASDILDEMDRQNGAGDTLSTALVFYDKKGLSDQDKQEIQHAVNELKKQQTALGITDVISVFDQPDLKEKLVSKNGTTMLVNIKVKARDTKALTKDLYAAISDVKVDHYFTSDWMINNDTEASMQAGLHKTESITVIFILLVLFIVFRSAVAPFIPLIAVGVTYIVSQALVAFLIDWFDFPVSNFTQIFLVAVLFGIGTDYCILLMSRFKEELPKHETTDEAIVATFKNGGRTVFFSGLAVFIGFASIGLSAFNIYQSAVAVAVGIAVLIAALLTIVPFFMSILGPKLFWPSKKALGHTESKLWGGLGRFALQRPLIAFLIACACTLPFLITYDGTRSFNNMKEISSDYPSIKGFNIIADNFNPGEALPTTIVLKNDERMDEPKYLETIEAITREVGKVDHVKAVRSATQPLGAPIKDFLVPNQAETLAGGLKKANDGVKKIAGGLDDASGKLTHSAPELKKATAGINDLIAGTKALKDGVVNLQHGLQQIKNGIDQGASGSGQIRKGLQQAKSGAATLAENGRKLLDGYKEIQKNLEQLENGYNQIQRGLTIAVNGLNKYADKHREALADPNFAAAYAAITGNSTGKPDLATSISQLNRGLDQLTGSLASANDGLATIAAKQEELVQGLSKLEKAIAQLEDGLKQASAGQGKAIANLPSLAGGLDDVNGGQGQLKAGFSGLDEQMDELIKGLDGAVNGLNQVSGGLDDASGFLNDLAKTNRALAGYYIPDQALENKDFKESLDTYMSRDRKITKLDVVFDVNPYSETAIDQIDDIRAAVEQATKDTPLENAKVAVGGVSSVFHDLSHISDDDYSRTAVLMLIGIGIVLTVLLKSFVMPIYLIGSLILTYFTAMGVTEALFVNLFGYPGINWAVPFFGFVVVIALGVDYSIFLMDRFNEYRGMPVRTAILLAMKSIGTVVISAAVILGGTFAAMMPSGVVTLMEIATIIIVALILYNLIILPLLITVLVRTFGPANWWPFIYSSKPESQAANK